MFSCFKDKEFLSRFIKISLPVMVSAFITFLVNFLDNIMVGTVSNEAVSGVYAANQITYLFDIISFGVLEGAGIFIQQFMGAKDSTRIKECFCYKYLVSFLFMLIAMPLIYTCGKYMISLYSKSDGNYELIMVEGVSYLRIVAISYIPYMIGYIYSTSLREIGETKYAMFSSILAVVLNTSFNALFIMGLKLGSSGAAYATIIARSIETLFLVILCHYKKFVFCINGLKNFKIEKDLLNKITKNGWLLFINEIGFSVGMVAQSMAYAQRDNVLSSISIVTTVSNIFGILINGLSTGIGVMVGADLGAGNFEKAVSDNKKLNLLGVYISLFCGAILVFLSGVLPNGFKEVDSTQKQLATQLIIIYGSLLFCNCLSVTSYFTLKVGGKSFLTFILDTGTMFFVYIPLAWCLALSTSLDMIWIYLIVRSLDILKALFGVVLMKKKTWLNNLTIKDKRVLDKT